MFVRLLALPDAVRKGHDLSSLQKIVHAAAPCPVEIKHRMIEWLGPIIYEYYGGSGAMARPSTHRRSGSKGQDRSGAPIRARFLSAMRGGGRCRTDEHTAELQILKTPLDGVC